MNSVQPVKSLEARIYASYTGFSPAERRLADVMLEHQMDLASYTAGELARKAEVSTATAARFIRALGYSSYPEAKRLIREAAHWGSPQGGVIDSDQTQSGQTTLAAMVQSNIDNIRATTDGIPPTTLEAVCNGLVAADRIWVVGLRNGFGLAHLAAHYFGLVKTDVRVLPAAGTSMAHELSSMRAGDVVIVFSFRRRPRKLAQLLQEIRASGALAVLITDVSAAASAQAADHVVRCRCHSPSPFNSFTAAATVIDYLVWTVAARLGPLSVERFRRIDRMVELMDDVSTPKR
ncbi:MurR/RpiR family transcriptional regulator [Paracoccus laeviglucosivorans]|uniref:Transcriptional regulator, RpiR family n=1 Tax=Paracoccus laeviglucosivorans TaxID=1197861 RepID=A0A521FNB6_9RHOB|nr:MurR/RpiR family transcriptional regulator [Paracoccus laeviglucosivorans]SMO97705.1 transcriptional regulator, RpiR family [Paracoccus laeviglucosivorans]